MRSTPARIVLFTVALMIAGAVLIKGCGDGNDGDPTASAFNGAPRGLLALRLLLDDEGVPVRVRTQWGATPPAPGALIVVPPPERTGWTKAEADAILDEVKAGAHALILCDDDDDPRNARMRPLLDAVGVVCGRADVPIGDESLTHAVGLLPAFREALYVRGAGRVHPAPQAPAFPAWNTGLDTAVVKRAVGAGMVTVAGSATVLANDGIAKADNAAWFLGEAAGRTVVFDERHHGARDRRAILDAAEKGAGPLTALVALLLLVPLSLLSLAPRPGDPPRDDDDDDGAPAAEAQARALAALMVRRARGRKPS